MKRCKSVMDDEDDDTISKLHDELLHRIIDLLPIKDVLRTSVLSSRWRNLPRSISNIDLGDFSFPTKEDRSSFLEMIDRILVYHDSSDIKKFVFVDDILLPHDWSDINLFVSSRVPMDASRIHRWISEVIKRNVQELRFSLVSHPIDDCIIPLCLFKSESLTVLEIHIRSIILGSSSSLFSVHLPSLKRLKLTYTVFFDNHSTQCFFNNIPNLQQLCLYDCNWEKVNRLIIDIPTLEEAEVYNRCRASSFGKRNRGGVVTISAPPSLTSFKCGTNFYMDFLLSNRSSSSSSLNVFLEADFPFHRRDDDVDDGLAVIRFLESVTNSMSLKVTWHMSKWLNVKKITAKDLPLFTNLKHFEISTDLNSYREVNLKKILMFLHNIPNLQSFAITLPKQDEDVAEWELLDWHFEEDWSNDDDVPSCVIHHLKKVSISSESDVYRFGGIVEIYRVFTGLIKYFMDHSQCLETLEIHWLYNDDDYVSDSDSDSSPPQPTPLRRVLDSIESHPRYSELKNFSCTCDAIPKRSKKYEWE